MGQPELYLNGSATVLGITPEQQLAAQLSIAHHATDAADCAELLAMLGINHPVKAAESPSDAPGVPAYRGEGPQKRRRAQRAIRAGSGRIAR